MTLLPETSLGMGMWVEITVPYVDIILANPPARSPWLKEATLPRLYYSQILWVDQVRTDESDQVWYRVNERYGYGDIFWAAAEAFRPLDPTEVEPIRPEVEDKKIIVDVTHQTMACYEGNVEVHFCRISSGAKFDASGNPVDKWSTPVGAHPVWRKLVSTHMSGGTTGGGYDLPGIGWTTLFVGNGVAIHSTFWHNDFGVPRSHGCVNAKPEDARWVFRWTQPHVPYDPGDVTVSMPGGTVIDVVES
jgi:lipoprotein-anchoring transpeptidase ErfK/SrfK